MTVKGYNKCCISNAAGDTDDDMLWNGREEDRDVRSKCEVDEHTDYGDGDSDTDW